MANEIFKELKTRIALKQNTYQYWTEGEGKDYIPLYGEVCLCEIPAPETNVEQQTNGAQHATNAPTVLFKVGTAKKNADGSWVEGTNKTFSQLNWVSALAADVYAWAKAPTKPTYRAEEITGIGEYIAKYVDEELGISVDTNTVYQLAKVSDLEYKLQSKAAGTDAWADVECDHIILPESTKVEESDKNGYIKVDNVEVQVFDDVFKADGKTVVAAGGIAAGSEVNGKTFQQILYNMMYPYQKPTISVSASPKNGGTFEKGDTQTITSVTATVTKRTEEIAKVELYNGSTLVATKNGDDALSSTNSGLVKNGGAVVFEGLSREVSANGGQYKAKVYDTTGGTAEASTGSFTFVYPYYIGICYDGDTIDEALVLGLPNSGENGDKGAKKIQGEADVKDYEFSYTKGSMVFAFPKSYGKLSSIKDPSNFEISGSFTIHEVNITGLDGTAQPYYVYVSGVATNKDFKVDFFK